MSQSNEQSGFREGQDARILSAAEVRAYLIAHPDFLEANSDLIDTLAPPAAHEAEANVLDLQQIMVQRLQRRVAQLKDIQADLIEATSFNALARERVHSAVLRLLDAKSFEELIDFIISADGLAQALDIDAIVLCVESATEVSGIGVRGVRILENGGVERILGLAPYALADHVVASRSLYGAIAEEIGSEALIRLDFSQSAPPGLLVIGSRDPDHFHPSQAGDLIEFIARIAERCIRLWLELPAPTKK